MGGGGRWFITKLDWWERETTVSRMIGSDEKCIQKSVFWVEFEPVALALGLKPCTRSTGGH
jgi:hypothetical protein